MGADRSQVVEHGKIIASAWDVRDIEPFARAGESAYGDIRPLAHAFNELARQLEQVEAERGPSYTEAVRKLTVERDEARAERDRYREAATELLSDPRSLDPEGCRLPMLDGIAAALHPKERDAVRKPPDSGRSITRTSDAD